MLDTLILLMPILLADIVNPVLFAFLVYAAGTDRPLGNSMAALLGHTASYLGFGILLAVAFDRIKARIDNPQAIDFGIGLLIGVLLLWMAWRSTIADSAAPERQAKGLTPVSAFGTGAIINLIGLPFALPYFAALDQMLKADLAVDETLVMLAGYNLAYALPFLMVPLLAWLMGERSRPVLNRINQKVDRASAILMPGMLGLVGALLLVDGLSYFVVGEGLF